MAIPEWTGTVSPYNYVDGDAYTVGYGAAEFSSYSWNSTPGTSSTSGNYYKRDIVKAYPTNLPDVLWLTRREYDIGMWIWWYEFSDTGYKSVSLPGFVGEARCFARNTPRRYYPMYWPIISMDTMYALFAGYVIVERYQFVAATFPMTMYGTGYKLHHVRSSGVTMYEVKWHPFLPANQVIDTLSGSTLLSQQPAMWYVLSAYQPNYNGVINIQNSSGVLVRLYPFFQADDISSVAISGVVNATSANHYFVMQPGLYINGNWVAPVQFPNYILKDIPTISQFVNYLSHAII